MGGSIYQIGPTIQPTEALRFTAKKEKKRQEIYE